MLENNIPEDFSHIKVLKPPLALPEKFNIRTVFLAGSIEQGKAVEWQSDFIEAFSDTPILFLNPRRDQWDSSWKQEADEPEFRNQVLWELEAQERAETIVMFFQPGTMSPVTLLELGLFAQSGKLVVCCPEGFWRKGNVDLVCERYQIPRVETVEELKEFVRERLLK